MGRSYNALYGSDHAGLGNRGQKGRGRVSGSDLHLGLQKCPP